MSAIGNHLYLFSNDGKVLTIDKNDIVKMEELPIKSDVAQVIKKDDKLLVLYSSGDILLYSQNGIEDTFRLQTSKDDHLIFLKANFSNNLIDILYVYDRKYYKDSFKYDGVIYSYNAENGKIINSISLPKINGMRLHDFELKRSE